MTLLSPSLASHFCTSSTLRNIYDSIDLWHCIGINFHMIGEPLLKKLNKLYQPSALINMKFKSYDLVVKTDEEGNPILLFIGKADKQGKIKGDRYARRLLKDKAGKIIKDHWDYKGKV